MGVEALLRWVQPDGTLLLPGEFVPMVEEMGLISAVGEWVLEEICRQSATWRAAGVPGDIFTSFNLSLGQLWQPTLVPKIVQSMESEGVDPRTIVVEITESTAMTDPARTYRILTELHEHGLRLAIDDFGTGYSSLSRLTHVPADILKIDRPFLHGVPSDPTAGNVLRAVVELARGLGMEPLAEGIENESQRRFLRDHGCPMGQGFYFGVPVPPEEILPLFREKPRHRPRRQLRSVS